MKIAKISAIGSYIPQQRVCNLKLLDKYSITEDFIKNKVGFIKRSIKNKGDNTTTFCIKAYNNLLKYCDFDKSNIKLLVVVTQNPDTNIPHTSALVHNILGFNKSCMTFDISQGCAGFVHAAVIVKNLLEKIGGEALIFTADLYSEIINYDSKNEALLFGDGASAVLMSCSKPGYDIVCTNFGTAPHSNDCLKMTQYLEMNGAEIYANVVRYVIPSVSDIIQENKDINIELFLMHQGSKYIIDSIRKHFGLAESIMPFLAGDYGNTVSSSIPVLLQQELQLCLRKNILISGFGVGFTWGTALLSLS